MANKWYYSIAGCTRATFVLAKEKLILHLFLGFCQWCAGADQSLHFVLASSCAALILAYIAEKEGTKQRNQVRGMENYSRVQQELGAGNVSIGDAQGAGVGLA